MYKNVDSWFAFIYFANGRKYNGSFKHCCKISHEETFIDIRYIKNQAHLFGIVFENIQHVKNIICLAKTNFFVLLFSFLIMRWI